MKQILRLSTAVNLRYIASAIFLGSTMLCASISTAQTTYPGYTFTDKITESASAKDAAEQSCTIINIQGAIARGTLDLFGVPGQGASTLFDPDGTAGPGDPGCFVSDPYPFTIESVQLNAFSAAAFGQPAGNGVGTYTFEVLILQADDDGSGCYVHGEPLFTSPQQSFTVVTTANQYPSIVPVGYEISEPFFVLVRTISWTGLPTSAPSAVLWSNGTAPNITVPNCRQYNVIISAGNPVVQDHNVTFPTFSGWHNVIVNGTYPDAVGDIDIAVSGVTADAEMIQSTPSTVTATVSNIGAVDIAGIDVVLTANGNTVQTIPVNLAAGGSTVVNFTYTPAITGSVILMVATNETGDVNLTNNSASVTVNVNPPADPCIFNDDIESYTLGGISAQDAQWATWAPTPPALDAVVSNEQANSGTQSVKVIGEDDMLYLLGNQSAGTWKIGFFIYMPTGSGGYFNLQKTQTPGQEFAIEVPFVNNGTGTVNAGTVAAASFEWDHDTWNEVEIVINIESDVANFLLNGELIHQWPWSWESNVATPSLTSIGAINFYSAVDAQPLMYVDDVTFCQFYNNTACEAFDLELNQVVEGDNTDATVSDETIVPGTGCWSDLGVEGDVWFQFEVPADGTYLVTTNLEVLDNDDTQILVFTSSDDTCEGTLTQIGCGDDVSGSNFLTEVTLADLTAGTIIWILVDGWDGATGTFQIAVQSSAGPTAPVNNLCVDAIDLSALTGGALGAVEISATFTNVDATNEEALDGLDCWDASGGGESAVQVSTWYTFTGDGNTYFISANDCDGGAVEYVEDTQLGIFTGECDDLTEVACVDDIDLAGGDFTAALEFTTEAGVEYTLMMDSWGGAEGEFCISFENMGIIDATVDASVYGFKLFPNPASNDVRIQADENMTNILILNSLGQLVKTVDANSTSDILIDVNQFAAGLYFVQATIDGQVVTTKLNIQ